jgi:hypothetical protein
MVFRIVSQANPRVTHILPLKIVHLLPEVQLRDGQVVSWLRF